MINFTDPLQFIRVSVMMWAAVHSNQEDRDMNPRETKKIQFKFVHVSRFAIKQKQ